jgi:hypothetical protein
VEEEEEFYLISIRDISTRLKTHIDYDDDDDDNNDDDGMEEKRKIGNENQDFYSLFVVICRSFADASSKV